MIGSSAAALTLRASMRYFLRHPAQLALAVLGLAIGVAAVISVAAARSTIAASFADFTAQRDGAASHRIEARDGWVRDAEYVGLRRQLGDLPMAPVLTQRVRDSLGNGWQLLGVDLLAERRFRELTAGALEQTDFPLDRWLAGEMLALAPASAPDRIELAGGAILQRVADLPPNALGAALVVDLGVAQQLAAAGNSPLPPGAISHVDVIARDDQLPRIEALLPARLQVRVIEGSDTTSISRAFELNLLALSLLALLVGAFIVFNTLRFFVLQRRRLFGLKRLLGMTAAQVARVIAAEALVLGLLGTGLGLALGVFLSDFVLRQMAGTVNALYYEVTAASASIGPLAWITASLVGIGGALAAAVGPALEAATIQAAPQRPAVAAPALSRMMAVVGATCLAGAFVLYKLPWLITALGAVFLLALGYVLCCIPLAVWLTGRLRTPLGRSALRGFAFSRLPFTLNRTAAALAALILAVATVVGVDHMINSFRASVVDWLNFSLSADAYVAVRDDSSRLPDKLVAELQAAPGVADTSVFLTREVAMDGQALTLSAQRLNQQARQALRFQSNFPADGWARWEGANEALISETLARRMGLAAGDELALPTPDGFARLNVLAIFSDYRSDGGRVIVSAESYQRAWGEWRPTSVGLYFDPSMAAEAQAWLDRRLAAEPTLRMAPTQEIRRESLAVFDRTFDLTRGLKWLAAIVAFVGVLGAVMALQLERRRESILLATLGMDGRDRALLLAMEALGLGLSAGLLALPLGAALAWMLTDVINLRAFGWVLSVRWQAATFALGMALAVGAAAVGAAWPMWSVARGRDRLVPETP